MRSSTIMMWGVALLMAVGMAMPAIARADDNPYGSSWVSM